jgi:hypothetical protein
VKSYRLTAALLTVAVTACALYYPVSFAVTFELLGPAVDSPTEGWLGPTPRGAGACVVDVGKVNSWVCADTSVFTRHRYGCQKWLEFFGLSDV